ncbi:MAG: metal ABC transporter ATP-binding protein [Brevinematales bacterium]|nr:metal ABC transporter ATP-binding protein [Brevinematales bacterium]
MKKREVIRVEGLSFGYTDVALLKDVSFFIREGEFVTIVGPNGGGKTTLLRLLLGLLCPWEGSITIYGRPHAEQRHLMGYVPQHGVFDRAFPMTVEEMVLQGRIRPWGWYSRQDKKKVAQVLDQVGLSSLKKVSFSSLSGGQLQRALIARALVSEAPILLLDEPSASIDSESEKQLFSLLQSLKGQKTIILVTHDTGFVHKITDRVLCIHRGVCEHPFEVSGGLAAGHGYGPEYGVIHHERTQEEG